MIDDAIESRHADTELVNAALAGDRDAVAAVDAALVVAVSRVRGGRDTEDERLSRLREALFVRTPSKLTQYSGRGALGAWLRVLATRDALTERRTASRQREIPTGDGAIDAAAETTSPELAAIKAAFVPELHSAMREAFGALAPEDRNLLRLHWVEGLSIDRIAAVGGTHRATAARRIQRAQRMVRAHAEQILAERRGVTASEFASIAAAVISQLELGFSVLSE